MKKENRNRYKLDFAHSLLLILYKLNKIEAKLVRQ